MAVTNHCNDNNSIITNHPYTYITTQAHITSLYLKLISKMDFLLLNVYSTVYVLLHARCNRMYIGLRGHFK